MHQNKYFIFAALLACLLGVQAASAQTPANLTVVSGSGQIYCQCVTAGGFTFGYAPLIVKVTDASNRPVANVTVNWSTTTLKDTVGATGALNGATTVTGADGTTSNTFTPFGSLGFRNSDPTEFQVTASTGSLSANFTLTQAYDAINGFGAILVDSSAIPQFNSAPVTASAGQPGYTFNGQAGPAFVVVVKDNAGNPVPGVSLRLANTVGSGAIAGCVTQAGADPGAVLTDSTGTATCTPVFSLPAGVTCSSSSPCVGLFEPVIGGIGACNCSQDPTNLTYSFPYSDVINYYLTTGVAPIHYQVSLPVPSSLTVVGGSGQTATAGQTFAFPLVAQVNTQTGTLSGQTVNWTVSPTNAGTLQFTTTVSDANGQVTNNLVLNPGAGGNVTVTATMAQYVGLQAVFKLTALPLITVGGMTKVSGDGQSAVIGTAFPSPLIVQLNSTSGAPVANLPVTFTATGGALLSVTQTTTGSNGQALVTVTAPAIAGSITVTASSAGFSQTFNLTANPPGPVFSANSFVNAADQKVGSISPCSLATIVAQNLAPGIQGSAIGNILGLGAFANSVANVTVTFGGIPAPIVSVANLSGSQQVTFQVPCNAATGSNQVTVTVGAGSATTTANILPVSPGVFQTGTTLTVQGGATFPLGTFVRPDGTFVTANNPARKGDTIIAFVTGLGGATPSVSTNGLPLPTAISAANNSIVVGIANAGVPVVSAQLSPDIIGVYAVAFQVPANAPSGNQVFSVGVPLNGQNYYSAGAAIPIQ